MATCAAVPDLDRDGPMLLAALSDAGADVRVVAWDDADVEWASFDVVLVRSTWDYTLRREEYLGWARGCRRTANPSDILEWNTDKSYLSDLERAGVATVPTVFVAPGQQFVPPTGPFVVKPAISASAADTGRFGRGETNDIDAARAAVAGLHSRGRTVMVQPYLREIDTAGETSLVFLGGSLSHAVRREPLLSGPSGRRVSVSGGAASSVRPVRPAEAQVEVALAALGAVPGGPQRLAYARVDLIPGPEGPTVLELELAEPFLFLAFAAPDDVGRLARATLRPDDESTR